MGNLSSLLDQEWPGEVSGRWTAHRHKLIQQSLACVRLWNSISAEQAAVFSCLCPAIPSCAVAPVPLHASTNCSQRSSTGESQLPDSAATWIMPQLLKGLLPHCCWFTQCHPTTAPAKVWEKAKCNVRTAEGSQAKNELHRFLGKNCKGFDDPECDLH